MMSSETCDSAVELEMLASGMAKQHENYLDAIQELIDNSVAASVSDESYFEDPQTNVEIAISIVRTENKVRTSVCDAGPGITKDALQSHVFRTGNKEISRGILNNVGWGLKASLAWFEESLLQDGAHTEDSYFSLVTKTVEGEPHRVDGPITGELPIVPCDTTCWERGIPKAASEIRGANSGTRVHVVCDRTKFDTDVWPSATALDTKIQFLRERLGVLFRRLLSAREDNQIRIHFEDRVSGVKGTYPIVPIWPTYEDNTPRITHQFTVTGSQGDEYDVRYEAGTLDIDSMTAQAQESSPSLLTQSGRFRYRYRPSQACQGVDIYANGRVLMTSVFNDLFDLSRNNQYNYFGGLIHIFPSNVEGEVPTDNKKTRLDTNNQLWQRIKEELAVEPYLPQGEDYSEQITTDDRSKKDGLGNETNKSNISIEKSTFTSETDLFGIHEGDAQKVLPRLKTEARARNSIGEQFVDATVTSPPYFDLKDYGSGKNAEVGQYDDYSAYIDQLRSIFDDIYDITAKTGSLWIIVNTFRRNKETVQLPFDIARACQRLGAEKTCPNCEETDLENVRESLSGEIKCPHCGHTVTNQDSWILQDIVVWDKESALPYTEKARMRNVFEYILCFSKSPEFELNMESIRNSNPAQFKPWWVDFPERYHPRGKLPDNIWEFEPPTRGSFTGSEGALSKHPATLPPNMVERILQLSTNEDDVILDPFAGSGVVVGQADRMDRHGIGIEINGDYCNEYPNVRKRLEHHYSTNESKVNSKELEQIICGLRQLKYISKLLPSIAEELGISDVAQLGITATILDCHELGYQSVGEDIHGAAEITLVVSAEAKAKETLEYEEAARKVTSNPPFSKFGVQVDIQTQTPEKLQNQLKSDSIGNLAKQLFIYDAGRHYVYSEKTSSSELLSRITQESRMETEPNRYPPIVSNLGLEINHPKNSLETIDRPLSGNHEFVWTRGSKSNIRTEIVLD